MKKMRGEIVDVYINLVIFCSSDQENTCSEGEKKRKEKEKEKKNKKFLHNKRNFVFAV